jgi:hypothetical protein
MAVDLRKWDPRPIMACPAVTGSGRPCAGVCTQYVPTSYLIRPVPESFHHTTARNVVLTFEGLGVDLQQDLHRVPGPLRHIASRDMRARSDTDGQIGVEGSRHPR